MQGLVGHLIGVEEDMYRCLSGDPAVADAEHAESTLPVAIAQAGRPPAHTRADWRRAADRILDRVRPADPGTRLALHGMRLSPATLLVARAFELWIHENDVRRATGRPASVPGPSALRLMTDLAARLLPHAAARAGLDTVLDVRLVLTGSGGGTWEVTVGGAAPAPASAGAAVSIVTDAVGFCRLAANRITPADLETHVTGDPGQATAVLAAASMLALD